MNRSASGLCRRRPRQSPKFTGFDAGSTFCGYSSGQALNALDEVARATLAPEMGYDFADLSYQERKASGTIVTTFGLSLAATAIAIFIIPMLFVLIGRLANRVARQAHASPAPVSLEGRA